MNVQLNSDFEVDDDLPEIDQLMNFQTRGGDEVVLRTGGELEMEVVGNMVTISYPPGGASGGESLEFDLITNVPGPVTFVAGVGVSLEKTETASDVKLTVNLTE